MFSDIISNFNLERILLTIPAILIALTLHELAHGFVALRLGDTTARDMGRLSLNPIKHLDPLGALFLLIVGFGWAKPVPVNPTNFQQNRVRGMALVGVAGPACNLLQALFGGILLTIMAKVWYSGAITSDAAFTAMNYFVLFLMYYVQINIVLMIFNLIPIPPLDGSRIVAGFLKPDARWRYYQIEQFGMIIMMLLCITPVISWILGPPVEGICDFIFSTSGIFGN